MLTKLRVLNMDREVIERFFADSGSEGEDVDEDVDVESYYDEEKFFLGRLGGWC